MSTCKQLLNGLLLALAAFLYPTLLPAQNNFTGIVNKDGKFGIEVKVDRETKLVVKPKYDDLKLIYNSVPPRVYAYKVAGKWGIITMQGPKPITVTQPEFDDIKLLNNLENYVFDLKEYYFLVWKAGKVALLHRPYYDGESVLSQFWDDIGVDTVTFTRKYKRPFMIKADGLYGVTTIFGETLAPVEYESFEKLTDRSSNDFYVLKKNGKYRVVVDIDGIRNEIVKSADDVWKDGEVFWAAGTDTSVCFANGIRNITEYRKMVEASDAYVKEAAKKGEAQKLKQEKVNRILNAKYQKKERVFLTGNREMYLLMDSFGIKCFDPEKAEFVYADKQLEHYYINHNLVFVQSEQGKWYLYPNPTEYKSITTVHPYVAAQISEEQYWIFGGVKSRQVYVEKGAEITEVTLLDNTVHIVYRLKGKYGFVSQDNSGYPLKKLPAVFTLISVISTYQNNPRLQLVYNGETVNAYHDDIQMAFGGKHVAIKADMYGASCGNPKCKNGVMGTSTHVEKGETVTKRFNNTTYWYKGHLVPADITIIETNPDRVITEKEYCKDPIHSVKTVMLFWDEATGTYKVEKH